jgi:2-C-methyl-D-erythritol 4-phosphate cytidylyltransferase
MEKGSAVPAVAATDSIRILENGSYVPANREQVRIIQTPQTFLSEWLLPAFEQPYRPSFTDEATVVEASGKKIHLIEGDHENIKITRPVDMLIAERIMGVG